jgi:DnaJ like chaperone protein
MWGKIGGAGLGFTIGGPIGALLGALAGHVVDASSGLFRDDRETVFTTGLIALSAKMAKADGVVTRDEVAAFRRIVEVPPEEVARITSLFDLAKQTTAGFDAYAGQLAERFGADRALIEDVLDGLFHIAKADGAVHEAERRYLAEVAAILGFAPADYRRIEARHVRAADDPYVVLGAQRDWTDQQLRDHWRALVRENHPDRQIALGLPPEAIAIATARLTAINTAWDVVTTERGMG